MSYHQTSINALTLLVELIRGGQPVEGRVRLQKLVYLLKAYGMKRLTGVKFRYHHYGPYSEQLAGALRSAVASELIQEDTECFDDEWQKFCYSLNVEHPDAEYLQLNSEEVELVNTLKSKTKGCHWRELELAATALFLERERGLSRSDALERALSLKPACRRYQDEAEQLLGSLDAALGARQRSAPSFAAL